MQRFIKKLNTLEIYGEVVMESSLSSIASDFACLIAAYDCQVIASNQGEDPALFFEKCTFIFSEVSTDKAA